jgi:Serine hydrolase (FSH1)
MDYGTKDGADVLDRIRDFPEEATAEDALRELMAEGLGDSRESLRKAIAFLYEIMEQDGPFDGIIGYSEGATIAATLLLTEQQKADESSKASMFKCAIFLAGWPPVTPDGNAIVLSDESDLTLDFPTCHVGE